MGNLALDIEEKLCDGFTAFEVAKMLNIPLKFVTPIEDDLYGNLDPRSHGPDQE